VQVGRGERFWQALRELARKRLERAARSRQLGRGVQPMSESRGRIYFFANGIFADQISGGDIHFFHMAQAAMDAGYTVHFFGGHALEKQLRANLRGYELTLTDSAQAKPFNANSFFGQFRLLFDYFRRFMGTLRVMGKIDRTEIAYAVSDYWFDVLPVVLSRAKRKLMIWHMAAPSFGQIVRRGRPDVDSTRVASFYYWSSQNLSILFFRFCRDKHLFIVHPDMQSWVRRVGYREEEISYISFGVDCERAARVPPQEKIYDAVWIGRVHRQKGIDDLLATLLHLSKILKDFRAVLIGNLRELQPRIESLGLVKCVEFSGFVSEDEKFRLFHASRVFLMTSRFEGSPRVVAESLVCNVPVVAYNVETYRAIFGDYIRYVQCFDVDAFKVMAERTITEIQAASNYLSKLDLREFCQMHSWERAGQEFVSALTAFS
jgi:glycosyltransferase involved in cell wall biosynthesis